MSPSEGDDRPIWAREDAFPRSPDGYGWLDAKGVTHDCGSPEALSEIIAGDRDARVVLVWTPDTSHMVLPEELPGIAASVAKGRLLRAMDDHQVAIDRIRWYGMMLGGIGAYILVRAWSVAPGSPGVGERAVFALRATMGSVSVGLCLLMFLILGFIPWYQARKRLSELTSCGSEGVSGPVIAALRFETWLASQRAPVTRVVLGLIALVGVAQLLPGDSLSAAGLLKDSIHAREWWRSFTAPFLHGNPLHFLMNASALVYLGKRVEVFARWPHVPLVFLLAAVIGCRASLWLVDAPSVGASGGLMGWLGFLLVFESLHARLVPRSSRRRLLAGLFLTALIGVVGFKFIDNACHAGGLLAGILYGAIVFPKSSSAMRPAANITDRIAGLAAMVVLAAAAAFAVWRIVGS